MGAFKLKKHGNSYGFTIPLTILNQALFTPNDEYELIVSQNSITFIKKRLHHSKWRFEGAKLNDEDQEWLESDFGVVDE